MSGAQAEKGEWPSKTLPHSWAWVDFSEVFNDRTDSRRKILQVNYEKTGLYPVVDQGKDLIGGFSSDHLMLSLASLPCIVWGDHTRCVKYIGRPFIQGADGVKVLEPSKAVDPIYAYKAMLTIRLPDKGYSRHFKFLRSSQFPLPPLAEQRRIVAKLDALTARFVRARAELERVNRLSELFRERAVVATFDGSLTARWREARPGSSAESDVALEKMVRCATKSVRRKPPAQIDWKPDIQLPPLWRWVSIDSITAATDYGTSAKTSDEDGTIPVLRMGNLQHGEVDWTKLKFLPNHHPDLSGLLLEVGDVLFNRTNSFELVGKTAIFRGHDRPVSFASYLIRLRPYGMLPALLSHYLNSPFARRWVETVASQQVGQANVNGSKLKALGIPLPSPNEQTEMLRLLDGAFARANRLKAAAARAHVLLDRLEASILTKAFRGELVSQDPADEPASVLLERIRTERAAVPTLQRKRLPKEQAARGV